MIRNISDHGIHYQALMFICPGCGNDLHMLPVNTDVKTPVWQWDGDLEAPTITPSILTQWGNETSGIHICHSFLTQGIFNYLSNCTHSFANQQIPIPDLPDWIVEERSD